MNWGSLTRTVLLAAARRYGGRFTVCYIYQPTLLKLGVMRPGGSFEVWLWG